MALPLALVAAGTLLGAYGSVVGGRGGRAAARLQAAAQREAAAGARAFAGFTARRQREADARGMGRQRAAIAKSGVELVGSPLDAYGASVRNAELNAQAILLEGELRARGLEAQARLTDLEGRAAARAGAIQAGTTVISSLLGATATGGGGGEDGVTPVRGTYYGEWAR